MSEQNIPGLPVAGYKATQRPEALDAVNSFKRTEERLLRQIDNLAKGGEGLPPVDGRWLAIGRTDLEKAFMAINRAVFQPQRINDLPEDKPAEEEAQPKTEVHTIGWAVGKLADGYDVRRPGWSEGSSYRKQDAGDIGGAIIERDGKGLAAVATFSADDVLATDWELAV